MVAEYVVNDAFKKDRNQGKYAEIVGVATTLQTPGFSEILRLQAIEYKGRIFWLNLDLANV